MDKSDFKLIQEMADAQKKLDDLIVEYKKCKKPTQLYNNDQLMVYFGKLFESMLCMSNDRYWEMKDYKECIVNSGAALALCLIWGVVLRSCEGRKTKSIETWLSGKYLGMDWINGVGEKELNEYAVFIIQYDPKSKLKYLINLTELLGFSITYIYEVVIGGIEAQISVLKKENRFDKVSHKLEENRCRY